VVRERWSQAEAAWPDVDGVARKPKAERDLKPTQLWYNTIGLVVEDLSRLSLAIANEARLTDPIIADWSRCGRRRVDDALRLGQ